MLEANCPIRRVRVALAAWKHADVELCLAIEELFDSREHVRLTRTLSEVRKHLAFDRHYAVLAFLRGSERLLAGDGDQEDSV